MSCDLQDIVTVDDAYRVDFIEAADILFFSTVNLDSPEELMIPVLERWPHKILVAGMGDRGCALGTQNGVQYFDAQQPTGPVVDTNGAGDGLAVGFLYAYVLQNKPLTEAIDFGQRIAAHICTQKASSEHLIPKV